MRPGPGLVVMALAFISGARRGSTSSISSKTTTTTSSPPPLNLETTTTTPSSTSFSTVFQTTPLTSPTSSASFSTSAPTTGRGVTITTTSLPPTQSTNIYKSFEFFGSEIHKEQPDDHQLQLSKRPKEPVPFNFVKTFFTRNSYNSYPSTSNYFAYTFPLPSHLTQYYDDPLARTNSKKVLQSAKQTRRAITKFRRRRRKRRARSSNLNFRGSGTGIDDTTENLNDSDDTLTSLTTTVDSSSDQTTLARGLPVHFTSLRAADSSRSIDEDDIFALVAEDDLLSEESFDHLVKLTNDKIGDTNEEDYSSGTETVVETSSGSGSGATENVHDTPDQQISIEDFGNTHQPQQTELDKQQLHKQNEIPKDSVNADDAGNVYNGDKKQPNDAQDSEQDIVDTVYNSHLVGNSNEEVVLLTEADSTYSIRPVATDKERRQVTTGSTHTNADLKSTNRYQTILGSDFALTRLNPWISACDLAQPGPSSAPDLQGECSAGTLPVAWVDEGPGPPMCLKSCKEETPFTNKLNKDNMINNLINNNSNNNMKNNNKQNKHDNKLNKLVGYTTTTNTFNIKLRNSQPTTSHSVNTNDNNNNNNNNHKNIDNNNNNNNNNKFSNIIQKLLNPFNYYQINNSNNNNKMQKARRNSKEISLATSDHSDVATKSNTLNATQGNKLEDSNSQALYLHSSEDYDLLHDMLMQQDKAATNKQMQHDDHQFNDAAITAAAVAMQLSQQPQQNHNNNDIVKTKMTAANYNEHNRQQNNQNNQFELKYNHIKYDQSGNSDNNNRKYQSNNIKNTQLRSHASLTSTTTNAVAANNRNNDQYLKLTPPEKQQQQCLEYLGDSDRTMPTHLCHLLTPSDRLAQLRHLRLRNCCERNVYSALHTLALNTTLSGGTGCLRVLDDLMELDALASRITCGLTEILFRFDCRQVYSIVHQCDDCKEAYRRWVCSTLVPYFAETSDVMRPPEILTSTIGSINLATTSISDSLNSSNTTMASNMTTSHTKATLPNNNNNNNASDMSSVTPLKLVTSNFITTSNNNQHDMQYDANNYQHHFHVLQQQPHEQHYLKRRNIPQQKQQQQQQYPSSNNNNKINDFSYKTVLIHNKNQPLQQQQQQQHPTVTITTSQALRFNDIIDHNSRTTSQRNHSANQQSINATDESTFGYYFHHKSTNKRRKRSDNSTTTASATALYAADNVVNRPVSTSSSSSSPSTLHRMQIQKQQQQQSFNFISTANNEDSFYVKNPVITKLLKRSKRKEFEFRKRRRIRPCLSVCQTVEQKCPYLLPADRAPSMPTQYAGEPTFLCLDYNIAETEEQLKKASHGPNDCCYTYCSNSANGICTYCDDMWDKTEIDKEADILSEENETKVFNITMKTKGEGENLAAIRVETKIQQKIGEEKNGLKMSTVAIAVRNGTALENATRLAERLQYYAFCDGVFYYDNDADDMPEYPDSGNCRKLPPVQSRCSIPYYATNYISSADMLGSYRKHNEAQKLLIWLSTLLCLWSCYSVRSMRMGRYNEDRRQQPQLTHQQQKLVNTAFKEDIICLSCQTREIMQNEGNGNEKIIKLWYDYRESRVLLIYWYKVKIETQTTTEHKKSLKYKPLIVKYLREIQRRTSAKLNLKILEIPSLIFLINYKKILLLLLFKKRQKLRRRKIAGMMAVLPEKCWSIVRASSCKNLKSKPKICSFNKNKKHYYYNYYYYYYNCSCRQIFSCSCNKNITNNNYYDNIKYIKKFKYNFSTCNFKINTKCNSKGNSSNKIIMMIMKINYKRVSIIKFSTTTTTTHTLIINSYNTKNNNNNNRKTNCYNIIIIIIITYNIYNNNKNKQIFDNLNLKQNNSHHHHYYQYFYNNYIYYYKLKFKPNNMINNNINVLLQTSALTLTLPRTSNVTTTIPSLNNSFKPNMISKNMFMITMMILQMLIMLIMPLLFKSFMKIKYNNNHHMKNIIKLKLSFSPNTSYNSKKINYRYSYYYNFNINDWWQRRRWLRRRRRLSMHQIVENPNSCYSRQSLSSRRTQDTTFPIILL